MTEHNRMTAEDPEFDDHYAIGSIEYEIMNCKTFAYRYECLEALKKEIRQSLKVDKKQFALQVAAEAMEKVPELEDEMPDELFEIIKNDKDALTNAFKIAVRHTKEDILKNIKNRLNDNNK